MFRPSRRRFTILLLLALAVVAPWPAPPKPLARPLPPVGSPGSLQRSSGSAFTGFWSEAGCLVDPSGACGAGSQAESGCYCRPERPVRRWAGVRGGRKRLYR